MLLALLLLGREFPGSGTSTVSHDGCVDLTERYVGQRCVGTVDVS